MLSERGQRWSNQSQVRRSTNSRGADSGVERIETPNNVGAVFRHAAALGLDAVLISPHCADPLYRRSVRVLMETMFQVPWARVDPWPEGLARLREAGFEVVALALRQDAQTVDESAARLALMLGSEGPGLSAAALGRPAGRFSLRGQRRARVERRFCPGRYTDRYA